MHNPRKSYLLVTIQFAAILLILLTGPRGAPRPLYLVGVCIGLIVGLWAVLSMQLATLTILPDVKAQGRLTRRGPYRYIRHPMYLAVLSVTLALVLDHPAALRLITWVILLMTILYKINYEEQLLRSHYPAYAAYQQQSKRLIPYLY